MVREKTRLVCTNFETRNREAALLTTYGIKLKSIDDNYGNFIEFETDADFQKALTFLAARSGAI